jgi:CHAT domain-containing protein
LGLTLEAVDVTGPWQWRWLLTDGQTGAPLADHAVRLDPAAEAVARFADLYGHAHWRAAPDRRVADGARLVAEAGAWAARELLGDRIGAAIVAAAPVTVLVRVPATASAVLGWPLELAHAGGRPLAARGDVAFVYDLLPDGFLVGKAEVSGVLRVLAVFSQPARTDVVALRRARYRLSQLMTRIAARDGARVELRVVQYGATRQRLAEIAESGPGWDVLQLFGHGGPGVFMLEHPDGSPDTVTAAELVDLLRPAKRRVKLAIVSACQSAAETTAHTLRQLGLADQAVLAERDAEGGPDVSGIARTLVSELGCAVVAMRYPVTDEFAIAFGDELYKRLLVHEQQADRAAAGAVAVAAGREPSAARPAVSLATPGVFGSRAAGLSLTVPRGDPVLDPARQRMAYFPPEPERFVGRAAAMAAASEALAPASGRSAIMLHGMAGAGKTAGALELAYRHQDSFAAAAFWQAPGGEFTDALANLALTLESQLGRYGFAMTGHIGTPSSWRRICLSCGRCCGMAGYCWSWTTWKPCSPPKATGATPAGTR